MARRIKTLFTKTGRNQRRRAKLRATQAGIKTVAICGVGLIGGSIAERLKTMARPPHIIGYDRKAILKKALRAGLIDSALTSFTDILSSADLVIMAANPASNVLFLKRFSRCSCVTSALIMDTGSMLSGIAKLAKSLTWENDASFISAHPMAGREVQGLQSRQSDLFVDHPFFFDDSVGLSARDMARIQWLTQALGSYPIFVDLQNHDRVMTDISQIPQLLSTVIGAFVQDYDRKTIHLAGTGLQSMIRLGGSPYNNWHDVFIENSANLSGRLRLLIRELQRIERAVSATGDLGSHFKRAQRSYSCLW